MALSTRVIDVRAMVVENAPRLAETINSLDQNVALAYCWIGSQTYEITADRIHEFMTAGIDYNQMPQIAQQVIQVLRIPEFNYIRIDACCIIQGDGKVDNALAAPNSAKEGPRMANH